MPFLPRAAWRVSGPLLALVLYVLSIGPVYWLKFTLFRFFPKSGVHEVYCGIYAPIIWVDQRSATAANLLNRYVAIFQPAELTGLPWY